MTDYNKSLMFDTTLLQECEVKELKELVSKNFKSLFEKGYPKAQIFEIMVEEVVTGISLTSIKMRCEKSKTK